MPAAVERHLAQLRLIAEDAARREDWALLTGLENRLRAEDAEWWPHVWAPMTAVAVRALGGDGTSLLWEAIEGGFRQPEMVPLQGFHDDPRWPALATAMAAAAPLPEIEVTSWPSITYGPALTLDRIPPQDEPSFLDRIPALDDGGSAWHAALQLLAWTTGRWKHANDHVASESALDVLRRVEDGQRFACVEYSIVLSQALNAVHVPARRVMLRSPDHHVGFGRGHVVTEAWIDDLDRWILLDGQNGAWWGHADHPLGLLDLQHAFHDGSDRPVMHTVSDSLDDADQDRWWIYFASASVTGLTWDRPLVPIFQGRAAAESTVVAPAAETHPDLSECETMIAPVDGRPGLTFIPRHPYAIGVRIGSRDMRVGQAFDLSGLPPGRHQLDVSTRTPFGLLAEQRLLVTRR